MLEIEDDASLLDQFSALWDDPHSRPEASAFLREHPATTRRERLDVLLIDQARRGLAGDFPRAEEYLRESPDLAADPDSRLDLVYNEFRCRDRAGQAPTEAEFAARFPELHEPLSRQIEVGRWLGGAETETKDWAAPSEEEGDETVVQTPTPHNDAPLDPSDYELGAKLGGGGMGYVFRAHQRSLDRPVAVKVIRPDALRGQDSVDRLIAEAKAAARLRHAHIVGVHGLGRFADGSYFLVMDLVEGQDLARKLKVDGPMSPREADAIVATVAEAVEHAHARGVVHRDLKPSNVLIDTDGRVLVVDFGLAKRLDPGGDPALTAADQVIGTPQYLAPEQADRRYGEVGPRTDVYGLGGLLFTLLTGRPPYTGETTMEVIARVIAPGEPPRIEDPVVPAALREICRRCLAKAPSGRFATAREVAEALRAIAPEAFTTSTTPDPVQAPAIPFDSLIGDEKVRRESGPKRARRRKVGWIVASVVAVLALAALYVIYVKYRNRLDHEAMSNGKTLVQGKRALISDLGKI